MPKTSANKWLRMMLRDDCEYYLREKSLARNSLQPTDSVIDQKRKFGAIILGDYFRAFVRHMMKGRNVPEFKEYQRHWLHANRYLWPNYRGIEILCQEAAVEKIRYPMLNKGYTYVGKMWGVQLNAHTHTRLRSV